MEIKIVKQPLPEDFPTRNKCTEILIDAGFDVHVGAHASRPALSDHADQYRATREQADAALAQGSIGNELIGSGDDTLMNNPARQPRNRSISPISAFSS